MKYNYICLECNHTFSSESAYMFFISSNSEAFECPYCSSRLTKPIVEKEEKDDSGTPREIY